MSELKIGSTREYIEDYNFSLVSEIPETVAQFWLKGVFPEHSYINNWTNKGFIVFGELADGRLQALYRHDWTWYVAIERRS